MSPFTLYYVTRPRRPGDPPGGGDLAVFGERAVLAGPFTRYRHASDALSDVSCNEDDAGILVVCDAIDDDRELRRLE